jgi:hypothetical protein
LIGRSMPALPVAIPGRDEREDAGGASQSRFIETNQWSGSRAKANRNPIETRSKANSDPV